MVVFIPLEASAASVSCPEAYPFSIFTHPLVPSSRDARSISLLLFWLYLLWLFQGDYTWGRHEVLCVFLIWGMTMA